MPTTNILVNNADNSTLITSVAPDPNSGGHVAVRDASTADSVGTISNTLMALSYQRASKGGNTTYQVGRIFFLFDTSGITETVSSATLNIKRNLGGGFDIIAVKSSAYGGDGSVPGITTGDHDSLDFSTPYSSATTVAASTGFYAITLNATALTDIKNNNAFIVTLCQHANDFSDSDPGAGVNVGFSLTINSGDASDENSPFLAVTTDDGSRPIILKSGLIKVKNGLTIIK